MKISNLFTVLLYRGQLPSEANNKLWIIRLPYDSYYMNHKTQTSLLQSW